MITALDPAPARERSADSCRVGARVCVCVWRGGGMGQWYGEVGGSTLAESNIRGEGLYLVLNCHHQFCVKMGSDGKHFNVS